MNNDIENSMVAGDVAGDYESSLTDAPKEVISPEDWFRDCAEYVIGDDVDSTQELRKIIVEARYWASGLGLSEDCKNEYNRQLHLLGEHIYNNFDKHDINLGDRNE